MPRPRFGAAGFGPGLFVGTSLWSLNSGEVKLHVVHLNVTFQQTPHFFSLAISFHSVKRLGLIAGFDHFLAVNQSHAI